MNRKREGKIELEQAQTVLELWRTVLRRFWILATVGLVGIFGSAFLAYIMPPVYEAEAKILVEAQQIPDELARSTVTGSAAERLQVIEQRLMTRDNLLRLIDDLSLFQNRPDLSVSDKIERLREATQIRPILVSERRHRRNDVEISAFTIKVALDNPSMAARVVNEFVTMVLEQNIRARSQRASETLDFFKKEEERLISALSEIEQRITTFKAENQAALPDSLEFRRQELTRLAEADRAIDLRLLELQEKRGSLEAALAQGSPTAPLSPEEQQLRALELTLAQKAAVYTDTHPEVRSLRAQIAAMEASLPGRTAAGAEGTPMTGVASAQAQIALIGTQIDLLQDQKAQIEKARAEIEETISRTPNIEMALNALQRRFAELQEQYALTVRKRIEAETGEKLEINQQAERFEVIENALEPEQPVSPDRKKILVLGSGMSLAVAAGLVFLIEMLRPAIYSAAQMERVLELRPVIAVPHITTSSERRRRAFGIIVLALLIGGGIPALLWAVDQYYMPLDLLGAKIIEKSGLSETIRLIETRL